MSATDAERGGLGAEELPALALRVREHVVRMATGGGCFIGAALSCVELLVYLYGRVLRLSPQTVGDAGRDYLLFSKGHAVPALYGVLAELGYFPRERLGQHLQPHDSLYWHPHAALPGVEFHSGSLGHLLAVGLGVAADLRLAGADNRVFVVLGDGELNEGSIWEACLVAAAQRLDNLVAVIDRNGLQANAPTEQLVPLEPLEAKFAAFGWGVRRCDGHDFAALAAACARLPLDPGRPTVIIADTVRGKGLPSLERRVDRWFVDLPAAAIAPLLTELRTVFGDGASGRPAA